MVFFFFFLGKRKPPQSDPTRARFSINAGVCNVKGDVLRCADVLVESMWHEYVSDSFGTMSIFLQLIPCLEIF